MAEKVTCIIVAAGPPYDYFRLSGRIPESAFVICADGGYAHAERLGLTCDLLMGDMDSLEKDATTGNRIAVSPIKDETDLMLAAKYAVKIGFTSVCIIDSLEGRIDHVLGNIQVLYWLSLQGLDARIISPAAELKFLHAGGEMSLKKEKFDYFSLFAYGGVADGVYISNAKYPLTDATLTCDYPLGVSNEFLEGDAIVSVRSGSLLIVRTSNPTSNTAI